MKLGETGFTANSFTERRMRDLGVMSLTCQGQMMIEDAEWLNNQIARNLDMPSDDQYALHCSAAMRKIEANMFRNLAEMLDDSQTPQRHQGGPLTGCQL